MMQRAFLTIVTCAALLCPAVASGQPYPEGRPRRQFVAISIDWLKTQPLHFAEHPLEDLTGTAVAAAQFETFDYQTRDGLTRIDVLEFARKGRGAGITLFPLGISVGATFGIRGSIEQLPAIRIAFDGPGDLDSYALTGGRAYDVGAGLFVSDRSAGWGLGSRAFLIAGAGRIRSDLGDGTRVFAEGGGGLNSGPFGVELALKFALNRLEQPVAHRFLSIPISLRGTVSF
jgi:hypothetical protein